MNKKDQGQIFIFLLLIFFPAEIFSDEPSDAYLAYKSAIDAHIHSLGFEKAEFLSSGGYGDILIVEPANNSQAVDQKPENFLCKEKCILKIVENFEFKGKKVCEKYQILMENISAPQNLLFPFQTGVLIPEQKDNNGGSAFENYSFCFLFMEKGLQNFFSAVFQFVRPSRLASKNQEILLYFFRQMLNGEKELLQKGVFHNDLQGGNAILFAKKDLSGENLEKIFGPNEEALDYFLFEAKLIDFDLIGTDQFYFLSNGQKKSEELLANIVDRMKYMIRSIAETNKDFILAHGQIAPDKWEEAWVKTAFPLIGEFIDGIEEELRKALEKFYEDLEKEKIKIKI